MALCDDIPTLSKTTVYNTLKLFVEHGASFNAYVDEKKMHVSIRKPLCMLTFYVRNVAKIYDLPFSGETKQVERIDMNGFFIEEIHQYYKGVCPACAAKEQGKEVG